jgi:hypothetical protein
MPHDHSVRATAVPSACPSTLQSGRAGTAAEEVDRSVTDDLGRHVVVI